MQPSDPSHVAMIRTRKMSRNGAGPGPRSAATGSGARLLQRSSSESIRGARRLTYAASRALLCRQPEALRVTGEEADSEASRGRRRGRTSSQSRASRRRRKLQ